MLSGIILIVIVTSSIIVRAHSCQDRSFKFGFINTKSSIYDDQNELLNAKLFHLHSNLIETLQWFCFEVLVKLFSDFCIKIRL